MTDENLISLQPGTIIAGKYEVVKCLGAGSMGLVYACRHSELSGHTVAVKVLFPEVARDKVAVARFRNEIFASYDVSHPNVVRAYEYIRDGDLVAYTMEYVAGGDLATRLGRPGERFEIEEIISIMMQMCSGIQAVHDAGIVHRDLKPENILLSKDGMVKIGDFGIARTGHSPRLTEHGGVVGTIEYVSPEYMLSSHVDWRSDIYAIGVLSYEMITGESPFDGDSVYAKMTKRLKSDPSAPSVIRPECPAGLDDVVLKAMRRDPEERYQSAAEMFYDLRMLHPESKSASAEHLSISKSSSIKYVGPTVEGAAENKAKKKQTAYHRGPVNSPLYSNERESPAVESFGRRAHSVPPESISEETEIRESVVTYCDAYADTGYESFAEEGVSGRMERVFPFGYAGQKRCDGVLPREVEIPVGDFDDRLQRLSEQIMRGRSIWLDVVTIVIAVFIGVGVGYWVFELMKAHGIGVREQLVGQLDGGTVRHGDPETEEGH